MITNVVKKIKGVREAEVRYATGKLLVTFDDAETGWDEIENAVTRLGYPVREKTEEGVTWPWPLTACPGPPACG